MVKKTAISESPTQVAPVEASVTFVKDEAEIHVPVHPLSPDGVFAPPVIIPKGTWTVVWTIQGLDHFFQSVDIPNPINSLPDGIEIDNPIPIDSHPTVWRTTFHNDVTDVNLVDATINLSTTEGSLLKGDPTIAVVKDPVG